MLRPPPQSTRLPYTTLFRSVAERSRCHVAAVDLTEEYCEIARWLNQLAGLDDRICVRQADVTDLPFEDATFTLMFSQHVQIDRKSTRLNSSHLGISYAVFCL